VMLAAVWVPTDHQLSKQLCQGCLKCRLSLKK
jgi:hypothetical protein